MTTEDILKNAKFYTVDQVSIDPSDIIIVKIDSLMTMEQSEAIKHAVEKYFVLNKVMVLSKGAEILIAKVNE